ncbi:MAG: methyl-accepting chemotaxis protein [Pseudomonadota bacterium]
MKAFDHLAIRVKLFVLPIVAAIGLVATIGISQIGIRQMAAQAERIVHAGEARSAQIRDLTSDLERAVALVRIAPSTLDLGRLAAERARFEALIASLQNDLGEAGRPASDGDPTALGAFAQKGGAVFDAAGQFAQQQALGIVDGPFRDATAALQDRVDLHLRDAYAQSDTLLAQLTAAATRTNHRMLVAGLIALFVVSGLAALLAQNLSRRTKMLHAQMAQVAEGDLTFEIVGRAARDELGSMAQALAVFRDALLERERLERKEAERIEAEQRSRADAEHAAAEAAAAKRTRALADAARDRREAAERDAMRAEADRERAAILDQQARALAALGAGLRAIAEGRLDAEICDALSEEYEPIRRDFNAAVVGLRDIVSLIASTTQDVRVASNRISGVVRRLAEKGESSAASIADASSSITALSRTIDAASGEVSRARDTATEASGYAAAGTEVVKTTQAAIEGVDAASVRIENIVGLIEDVAFQTNLLALNAGVEAARAGAAGRGFAVVANEVRALSHKTAEAAGQIAALIGDERQQVQRGADLMIETGKALSDITTVVTRVLDQMTAVADAALEQAESVVEIEGSVTALERSTAKNAALFNEAMESATMLSARADDLSDVVERFAFDLVDGDARNAGQVA